MLPSWNALHRKHDHQGAHRPDRKQGKPPTRYGGEAPASAIHHCEVKASLLEIRQLQIPVLFHKLLPLLTQHEIDKRLRLTRRCAIC